MAKATLPTNYQDDVLKSTMGGKRRYTMTDNSDGTKTIEDATQYDKVGSNFGAADINKTNTAVNASADASKIIDNIDDIAANTQAGYMAGALALKKINSDLGALNDGGNIKGMDAREDGVYITYVPTAGADAVTKKLGNVLYAGILTLTSYNQNGPGNANFDLKPLLSNYASLTTANMCIEATYFKGFEARVNNLSIQGGTGYTYTYDAMTGILTVSGMGTVNYSYKSRPEKIKLVVLQDDIA